MGNLEGAIVFYFKGFVNHLFSNLSIS